MMTQKQLNVKMLVEEHIRQEIDRLDELSTILVTIMKGYEPLLGSDGPGNTHGDNMVIMQYGMFVSKQISNIIYNTFIPREQRDEIRTHLYNKYFNDPEIIAWKHLLSGII